ncbi:MAG TPA: 6-carboxytetrahydropterin synthase QueD [Methanosarcina sp.]|nr:6-carboxytetrahydropterin synthase QueD [Methanosarcina sp.]
MFELKVVTHFAAAHQLKMVAKKCENLHGHNWKIEVCVAGENLNDAGILMDFGELKQNVSEIMTRLDHKFLNELDYFNDQNPPSSENIAVYIANSLQSMLKDPKIRVTSVTAWESENSCAKYLMVNPLSSS